MRAAGARVSDLRRRTLLHFFPYRRRCPPNPSPRFFVNWLSPPLLDVASVWIKMLATILDDRHATSAERDAVYARSGARAYRVQL